MERRVVRRQFWSALIALSLLLPAMASAADFGDLLKRLNTSDFNEKTTIAESIAASDHPRAAEVLSALAEGHLFVAKANGRVLIQTSDNAPALDAATGEPVPDAGNLDNIIVNLLMRRDLAEAIARLELTHPDADQRLAAAQELYGELDSEGVSRIEDLIAEEDNTAVRDALETAVALALLEDSESKGADRLQAIEKLKGNLEDEALNALRAEKANADTSTTVRAAASAALASTEFRIALYDTMEQVFFGLSLGAVLLLAAIGLAITFGVMGVINMAHGEFLMLGAYTTYVIQQLMPGQIGMSLVVAIPAAFLVTAAFGVVIERSVIRFLYGRPLETLLATFGISLVLQQLVRTVFSPLNRAVITPDWLSGSIVLNPALSLTVNRLVIIAFALLVFAGLVVLMKRTSLGLKVRAVAQNRAMAKSLGVRTDRVDALTFGLGAGIAGIAGVALSQLTNVGPNLGQSYIIDSFLVVVFGGVGNLWGTLVSAFSLGILNQFLEPYAGAVLAKILVLTFIILFIQKRPRGLFPQHGRAAEA